MQYDDGTEIALGDIVSVPVPTGTAEARIVMLGDTYAHLELKEHFLNYVLREKVLKPDSVVVEWVQNNPFTHNDPHYAPVGNYMFTVVDEWVKKIS